MPICFASLNRVLNGAFCLEFSERLAQCILRKEENLWWPDKWVFHYNNASCYTEISVKRFLTKKWMPEQCDSIMK